MIKDGSKVKIHYTLTVEGEVADSSRDGDPLEYEHGSGMIIVGLEEQLLGKKPGDAFQATIPPAKAYGEHAAEAVQEVPKESFGEKSDQLQVGGVVTGEVEGRPFQAFIKEVGEATVTLDLNHPLAGKTLEFDVEVVEVL